MTQQDTANRIKDILRRLPKDEFHTVAHDLLDVLGYHSERTLPTSGDPADLFDDLPDTGQKQEFLDQAVSARIVFQVTEEEIKEITASGQLSLINTGGFDDGIASSFLFITVVLKESDYARGRYVRFTREINKRFSMPTSVLFKTATDLLTLAFIHRRPHKRDPSRDVLGSVSLVREIDPNPDGLRTYLEILGDLALDKRLAWMEAHGKPINFDGLLAAWLDALDTEELNRRFYRDLSDWFGRAAREATFPTDQAITLSPEEHLIRLITRLLFIWFMKEKSLVAGKLFVENQVEHLLKNYDREKGDSYYRTVLQNLFFATLNTEITQRRFSRKNNADHRNFSVYRYQENMRDPDALRALFDQTPFINGGLFDCLDSFEATQADGVRIDCFSDVHFHKLSIPNSLFFDGNGLIPLFNRYKFTVEENTPVEQEVALDPELLGKVFENLLAAYNPETRETARKQTGSYYTPRVVVDYMVDEVLVASLTQKFQPTVGDREFWQDRLRYILDYADAFNDARELFDPDETAGLVRAIAELKVLDPAVGSGAFSMGVLHKLTLALRRLDPDNKRWEAFQKELATRRAATAFDTPTQQDRDEELTEISDTFERYRDSDFGRKLYLMQNSIFGVDIQPVACQIAKLRFFISLAIEQEPDRNVENFGIKPLPNLETRFIAANTLIGLRLYEVGPLLQSDAVQQKRKEIKAIREKYFLANNRRIKRILDHQEKEQREQLEQVLEALGAEWVVHQQREMDRKVALLRTPKQRYRLREEEEKQNRARKKMFDAGLEDARKIARWNPYDQNAKADWFDAEYMFGVSAGFDVIIGNPPYISHDKISKQVKAKIKDHYHSYQPFADIYCYFIEKAIYLQNEGGILSFITSNSYLRAEYGKPVRELLRSKNTLLKVLNIERSQIFDRSIVNVVIIMSGNSISITNEFCTVVNSPFSIENFDEFIKIKGFHYPQSYFNLDPWNLVEPKFIEIQKRLELSGQTLEQLGVKIRLGIATGSNEAFIINEDKKLELCQKNPANSELIKPILRGKDIFRYVYTVPKLYILLTKNGINVENDYPDIHRHLDSFGDKFKRRGAKGEHWTNLRACSFYDDFKKEKIVWIELADSGRFALCDEEIYLLNSAYFLLPPFNMDSRFLLGILNSSTIRFYLNLIAETSGMGTSRWINNYVKEFPIPTASKEQQAMIIKIVNYIIYLKKQPSTVDENLAHARDYVMVRYFEQIIDGLVYELYLRDELHRAGKCFFNPMQDTDLPPLRGISGDKMSVLRNIFEQLFDRKHPVRKNLFFLDSLETIRIIEGKA